MEIRHNIFEDVGADCLRVEGGALVFERADGQVVLAYAPTTWLTVSLDENLEGG